MLAELNMAVASAKALASIVSGTADMVKRADIVAAVGDLNLKLLSVMATAAALSEDKTSLLERVRNLEEAARKRENWDAEIEDYTLRQVAPGVFAHIHKDAVEPPDAMVKFCSHCFGEQQKSILQQSKEQHHTLGLSCPRCRSKLLFDDYIYST